MPREGECDFCEVLRLSVRSAERLAELTRDALAKVLKGDVKDWRDMAYLVYDYVPPNPIPRDDKIASKVSVYFPLYDVFLRFDDDPCWDIYGEDYETADRARAALAKAPPPRPACVTFTLPLPTKGHEA